VTTEYQSVGFTVIHTLRMLLRTMGVRLIVDMERRRVAIQGFTHEIEFKGQWTEFYALLAVRRSSPRQQERYTTAEELHGCVSWRSKQLTSVGKVVSRHLAILDTRGAGDIVQHQGKTLAWRLALDPQLIEFHPPREVIERRLREDSSFLRVGVAEIAELRTLVDATIMLEKGEVEGAFELMEGSGQGSGDPGHRGMEAWRTLLTGRIAQRYDRGDLLEHLISDWEDSPDPEGKAVYARLLALEDFDQRFERPDRALRSLEQLAIRLQGRGDIASLAPVWNVMGLLARRSGDPILGAEYHARAVAVFGLLGDLHSLQAAVFDLAICRTDELDKQGRPPDHLVLDLVDTCLAICGQFGVGADSAQAEIAGCRWAVKAGDVGRARGYLRAAEELLKSIPSTFDQACFLLARAELDSIDPHEPGANPRRDFNAALRMFEREIGDQYMVEKLHKAMETLKKKSD